MRPGLGSRAVHPQSAKPAHCPHSCLTRWQCVDPNLPAEPSTALACCHATPWLAQRHQAPNSPMPAKPISQRVVLDDSAGNFACPTPRRRPWRNKKPPTPPFHRPRQAASGKHRTSLRKTVPRCKAPACTSHVHATSAKNGCPLRQASPLPISSNLSTTYQHFYKNTPLKSYQQQI